MQGEGRWVSRRFLDRLVARRRDEGGDGVRPRPNARAAGCQHATYESHGPFPQASHSPHTQVPFHLTQKTAKPLPVAS